MTPAEERAVALVDAAERWRADEEISEAAFREIERQFAQRWRAHGMVVQAVFLLLTAVAQLALFALLHTLDVPEPGLVTGVTALVTGELLIRRWKWFATGVEASLWLGGLIALITALPDSGKPEALLLVAAAAAAAGARVRNPLFGVAAAALVVAYAERKADAGTVCAVILTAAAAVALLRIWRRPSTEWFWAGLAVLMPVAGWMAADRAWLHATIALYLLLGALTVFLAVRFRHHALFLSGALSLAIAATEIAGRIEAPQEAKLAAAGAFLLALSWTAARLLRDRTSGIVATPAKLTRADEALEIAGALAGSEGPRPEPAPDQGGGGRFGGAGATGEF